MSTYGKSIYLSVSNYDSVNYFPDNKPANFRVKLSKRLELGESWKIALCEIRLGNVVSTPATNDDNGVDKNKKDDDVNDGVNDLIYIHCNVCIGLVVDGIQTRVLRTLPFKNNQYKIFPVLYYIPVETRYIDTIEFHISTSENKSVSFNPRTGQVMMTLHLKKC